MEEHNELQQIRDEAASYAGCMCNKGDCEPGDCWPCRMMSIVDLAETALETRAQNDGGEALEIVNRHLEAIRKGQKKCKGEQHCIDDYQKDIDEWETIRQALSKPSVDVEQIREDALSQIRFQSTDCYNLFDHLHQQGHITDIKRIKVLEDALQKIIDFDYYNFIAMEDVPNIAKAALSTK